MNKIFEIAAKVSTPLGISGLFAVIVLYIFKAIIDKEIFPSLSTTLSHDILISIIDRLFILALAAMIFGFIGYMSLIFVGQFQNSNETGPLKKNNVGVKMIFGTNSQAYEDILKAKIEDNPMIIFMLTNKDDIVVRLRGPFTHNKNGEEVVLFLSDWIVLDPGGFKSIAAYDFDLLEKYSDLWFEDHKENKYLVTQKEFDRVKKEIIEFKIKHPEFLEALNKPASADS
ncbi:hypothetical protein GMJAKD_17110 [Candidatus Electrothrix aarhusensis]